MEAPSYNVQDFKDLLLISCRQIPKLTFRGLVVSRLQGVGGVLVAKGGDLHNIRLLVIMLWLIGIDKAAHCSFEA